VPARKKTNGRWFFRKWIQLPNGTRTRITGTPTTNTKKAAEHAERIAIEEAMNPSAPRPKKDTHEKQMPTVEEYGEVYIEAHEKKQKPNAIKSRRQIMNANVLPVFGHLRLDQIRQVDIDMFQADMLESRAGKTVNNILSALSSLMKYALKNGVLKEMRLSFFLKAQDREIQGATSEEIEALLEATDDQRYRVAILLGSEAGLRVGEIRALRWQDINEIGGTILVCRSFDASGNLTTPKNGKSRSVPLTESLADELTQLTQLGETVLTKLASDQPLSYWAVRDKMHDIYEAAEVTPKMVWHSLRHAYCSRLAAEGVPINIIKELAGHASIETTLKYMHTSMDAKKEAIAGVFGAPKRKSFGHQVGTSKALKK
jgi:integrase